MLLYAAICIPYKVAFIDQNIYGWDLLDLIIDCLFLFDVVLNFFSAVYLS